MKIEVELNINLGLSPVLLALLNGVIEREQSKAAAAPVEQTTNSVEDKPKGRGRPPKVADKAATPPADPAPSEAVQDAADETAEKEAAKIEEKPAEGAAKVYDLNDMRAAGKAYADAYGMEACLKDIPQIIGFAAFSQVPAEKANDVARLVLAAVEQNPFDREPPKKA